MYIMGRWKIGVNIIYCVIIIKFFNRILLRKKKKIIDIPKLITYCCGLSGPVKTRALP